MRKVTFSDYDYKKLELLVDVKVKEEGYRLIGSVYTADNLNKDSDSPSRTLWMVDLCEPEQNE